MKRRGPPIICDTPGCGGEIPVGGEGHPEICPACLDRMEREAAAARPPSPYHKGVPTKTVDVYRVLVAFGVTDPCIQHAIKKLLCPGQRKGGKTVAQDVHEALWSLQRWEEMRAEEAD